MQKRFLNTCLMALIVCSIFVQCKKSSTAATVTPVTFSPLTTGSSWTYQNNGTTSFTLTATNRDTLINGRSYKVLSNSGGTNNYLAVSGSDYYRFGDFPAISASGIEELYLKDNLAVSGVWTATQNITTPIAATITLGYSIKEKGTTRTVAGKLFSNVTKVRLDLSVPFLGNLGGGDFYYAEGVGMIENNIAINAVAPLGIPAFNQTQILTSYTIK
jgi:hypothetical protein